MVLLSLWKPEKRQQDLVAQDAQKLGFNYEDQGCTSSDVLPAWSNGFGWVIDHRRVRVGKGKAAYEEAKKLVKRWGHFQLSWAQIDPCTPVEKGARVCVAAKSLFLWTANPLQIVFVEEGLRKKQQLRTVRPPPRPSMPWSFLGPLLDASKLAPSSTPGSGKVGSNSRSRSSKNSGSKGVQSFRFAHGCLRGHLLAGEERFAVEWDKADDSVWYEVFTISRPAHPLAVATYPLVRFYQGLFGADSAALVEREVAAASSKC